MVEADRFGQAEQAVEGPEVVAEEFVEAFHRLGRVVVAEPPEPVGAFADGQAPKTASRSSGVRRPLSRLRSAHCLASQSISQARFLSVADPGR